MNYIMIYTLPLDTILLNMISNKLFFKDFSNNGSITVVYHHPCNDGFSSALIVKKWLNANYPECKINWVPASHGKSPPDVKDTHCIICDFSYNKTDLTKMIEDSTKLIILDHHKTAQEGLLNIPDENKIFDMNESGASLTWKFFYPDKAMPLLIQYVKDRDIWLNKMPLHREWAAWFFTLPFEFDIYEKYLDDEKLLLEHIKLKGTSCLSLVDDQINWMCKGAAIQFFKYGGKYYFIKIVNSSVHASDVGNQLIKRYPLINFSVIMRTSVHVSSTRFSLRSSGVQTDVSQFAKLLGGGGHRNASGCAIDLTVNCLPGVQFDSKAYWYLQSVYIKENIVYITSDICKKELGRYLLQRRYGDVLEGVAIWRSLKKHSFNANVTKSAVRWYDEMSNETTFMVFSLNKPEITHLKYNGNVKYLKKI